jgi:hypothetical protein
VNDTTKCCGVAGRLLRSMIELLTASAQQNDGRQRAALQTWPHVSKIRALSWYYH